MNLKIKIMNWLKHSVKILTIFFLLSLFNISLKGQDIMIESENVQTSLNGITTAGFINLSFHPEVYPVLIEYSIPGGGFLSVPLSSGSYSIPNIIDDVGNYSFNITTEIETEEECCTNFDVFISRCFEVTYAGVKINVCNAISDPDPGSGGQILVYGDGNIGDTGLEKFTLYSNLNNFEMENILPVIKDEASYSTDEIKNFGSTEGLIHQQDEVISDKDLIFKFDSYGNMLWVFQSKTPNSSNNNEDKAEEKENNMEEGEIVAEKVEGRVKLDKNISSVQLFPNPFRNNLNVKFHSSVAQEITIRLINTNGQRIAEKRIMVVEGNNKINLFIDSNINADGLYFLQIFEDAGNMITKQVVKIK